MYMFQVYSKKKKNRPVQLAVCNLNLTFNMTDLEGFLVKKKIDTRKNIHLLSLPSHEKSSRMHNECSFFLSATDVLCPSPLWKSNTQDKQPDVY